MDTISPVCACSIGTTYTEVSQVPRALQRGGRDGVLLCVVDRMAKGYRDDQGVGRHIYRLDLFSSRRLASSAAFSFNPTLIVHWLILPVPVATPKFTVLSVAWL